MARPKRLKTPKTLPTEQEILDCIKEIQSNPDFQFKFPGQRPIPISCLVYHKHSEILDLNVINILFQVDPRIEQIDLDLENTKYRDIQRDSFILELLDRLKGNLHYEILGKHKLNSEQYNYSLGYPDDDGINIIKLNIMVTHHDYQSLITIIENNGY